MSGILSLHILYMSSPPLTSVPRRMMSSPTQVSGRPNLNKSRCVMKPVWKAMAFGGVETTSMKGSEQASPMGSISSSGSMCREAATP